jgi:hypothetical protein
MKQVWIGVVFFLLYGLFTIKSQAAEVRAGFHDIEFRESLSCPGN